MVYGRVRKSCSFPSVIEAGVAASNLCQLYPRTKTLQKTGYNCTDVNRIKPQEELITDADQENADC